jgi:hypothetical protein
MPQGKMCEIERQLLLGGHSGVLERCKLLSLGSAVHTLRQNPEIQLAAIPALF